MRHQKPTVARAPSLGALVSAKCDYGRRRNTGCRDYRLAGAVLTTVVWYNAYALFSRLSNDSVAPSTEYRCMKCKPTDFTTNSNRCTEMIKW